MHLLNKFALKYRFNIKHDPGDGTDIIHGSEGNSHIFQYGDDLLGVMIMPDTDTAHRWNSARSAFVAAGMTICQDGDCEGTATFDSENAEQGKLAIRYAKIKRKRAVSETQRLRLQEMGFKRSQKTIFSPNPTTQEGDLTA
jgi:hypothetical protein